MLTPCFFSSSSFLSIFFFFFNDTATTEIYTLSLHDALPISPRQRGERDHRRHPEARVVLHRARQGGRVDRKSTRLNSSHSQISYAVFCLKKKKKKKQKIRRMQKVKNVQNETLIG